MTVPLRHADGLPAARRPARRGHAPAGGGRHPDHRDARLGLAGVGAGLSGTVCARDTRRRRADGGGGGGHGGQRDHRDWPGGPGDVPVRRVGPEQAPRRVSELGGLQPHHGRSGFRPIPSESCRCAVEPDLAARPSRPPARCCGLQPPRVLR